MAEKITPELLEQIVDYVEYEKYMGVEGYSLKQKDQSEKVMNTESISNKENVMSPESKAESLEELRKSMEGCKKCKLHSTRTNIVFGSGSPNAEIMFIGEAPGKNEDLQGLPFVGRAGNLLTKIIESIGVSKDEPIGFNRNNVYIANILKSRPPENRNPEPEEIELCSPFLFKQIEIIKPKIICSLGTFSAQTLLKTKTPISRLRGQFYPFHGSLLIPTFHPAYLLRSPTKKADVWEDMQMLAKKYLELNGNA